jgi:hypothetical protein
MSKIEDLVYSANEHGQRTQLFEQVKIIKEQSPYMPLEQVYEKAYEYVMKT